MSCYLGLYSPQHLRRGGVYSTVPHKLFTASAELGKTGTKLTEHFHILGISRNVQCQIAHVASQFYIHDWNMVQSQDI